MSKRGWTCLIIEANETTTGRVSTYTAAQPEIAKLLGVPEGREPICLRSKQKSKVQDMQAWLMDYRDAQNAEEMATAHSLPHNYAAWAVLSPLGYHSIMRERYFRGRVVITGASAALSVPNRRVAELTAAWRTWYAAQMAPSVPRPRLAPAANDGANEDEDDDSSSTPPPEDDRHAETMTLLASRLGTLKRPVPSLTSPY
jgi:hypothetical protein